MDPEDEMGMEYDGEDDAELAREEVEDLPNYGVYESDGGESLSDGRLSLSDEDEEQDGQTTKAKEDKTPWTDQVRLIHLRRYIDDLAENVREKDYEVAKARAELKECSSRVEQLEREWKLVNHDRELAVDEGNIPAVDRLVCQLERIQQEVDSENNLYQQIKQNLSEAEYELSQSQVEQGKMLLAEDELKNKEDKVLKEKRDMAASRQKQEKKYAENAVKQRHAAQRLYESAVREKRKQEQEEFNSAKQSQSKASKHLQRTISKLRERSAEEKARETAHINQRMTTMMALKQDISANRENLRALQNRDRAMARAQKQAEEQLCREILNEGGNPSQDMIKRKAMERFEKEKQVFALKQRERQVEIAEKILDEERRIERRKRQQPQLWATEKSEAEKIAPPHPKPVVKAFDEINGQYAGKGEPNIDTSKFETTGDESDTDEENILSTTVSREHTKLSDAGAEGEGEDGNSLAQPEFEGLWDQHKPYKVPKDAETGPKLPGASKMDRSNTYMCEALTPEDYIRHVQQQQRQQQWLDGHDDRLTEFKQRMATKHKQEIMDRVLSKHREGIIIEQVAGGKKFTGCPFYSKPNIIHFKDFEVGKTYKKKVTLTNVSYSVNYCKLIGITEHLKDFIDVLFDPPGQMSAGLTCEMLVTFKPMINEDLIGMVDFLAQTGPFSVPLKCTTKKCDLKVDHNTLEFGVSVIGETLKRSFTLSNNGALGTKFSFYKVTGMKMRETSTAETSLGGMTSMGTIRNVSPDSDDKGKLKKSTDTIGDKKQGEDRKVEEKADTEENEKQEMEDGAERVEEMDMQESSQMPVEELEELMSLDGMCVGNISAGFLGPFSSIKLEVIWQPTIPGRTDTEFMLSFEDEDSENISVTALASAIDVPVWVQRETVDLKICMFDRLYQDTLLVNNRATTALRLKFEVCKELRNHLELLPKTGYIQAQSTFSAQLKFLPRKSLFEDATKFFDKETGVLEAPMLITVADQTRPVPFTVHAVVTNSELAFDMTDIDFGHCTIYESVCQTVRLTNHSILSQQFGFVGIPDYVDVQPNDGFGTLLPLETVELDIIFQPKKARDFIFELTCKSLINREFKISCRGVGVHPPLELSDQIVHLKATAVNDVSMTAFHVINSHTSMNEFSHPVPRIGKGEIAPVGPTSFEFVIPEDAPLTISPSVGTVEPGKKCRVNVRFTPRLLDEDIKKEAVRMVTRQQEAQAAEEFRLIQLKLKQDEANAAARRRPLSPITDDLNTDQDRKADEEARLRAKKAGGKDKGKKKAPPKGKASPKGRGKGGEKDSVVALKGPRTIEPPTEDSITKDSDAFAAAQASLLRQFRGKFSSFRIPCFVASGKCGKPGELPYSIHNTLYIEVHCPAVRPELVVISDSGRATTDYGNVSIGQSVIHSITVQNISQRTVDLGASSLNTAGPFSMLNALRMLPPEASHTILTCFMPLHGEVFQEVLEVISPHSTLHLTLRGRGVSPVVSLSIKENVYDMGGVLAGEYREEPFKIANTASLAVQYSIKLDSQSLLRHSKAQAMPAFVRDSQHKPLVGVQNTSGAQVFDCVPAEGVIPAGGEVEVTLTFAPDHSSDHFSDGVRIELFGQEEQHVFKVTGQAKLHIMYMGGGDPLSPPVESLAVLPPEEQEEDGKLPPIPLLVSLQSVSKETEFSMATRDIFAGCVRTMAVSQKKNGEFIFDNVAPLTQLGFNIEPQKGMIEAGSKKPITFTWTPPQGFDPNQPLEASINCTLKGDVTEVYRVMLRGYVISE